ncbi:probable E3 ubiquitin-protein ligase HERC4 [Parambassis ranga]|uniref:Probable E3 ubiquitin-protein ligase HERC4 n=1 Tax=Parambassis ranga TaxID=210632 RepID=A0A6P7ISX5_9TELE|nr:probable E3 ubiquitin-protein ligase HERC4 [Parambassis ranga]
MFSWGEDCQRGFWLKDGSGQESRAASEDGVCHLNISYHIAGLSAGHSVLAFVKNNGNAFIIRTHENRDGRRQRGKQKFVKCKERVETVSCGDDVVTLLSERGTVLCVDTTCSPFTPRALGAFSNIQVCQVACGSQHSVALTKGGQVYTWGKDSRGQLGLGKRKSGPSSPQHLQSLSAIPVVRVAAGGEQSFILSVSGGVFGWGRNDHGQLGLGHTEDKLIPTCVHSLNMKQTIAVSCGKDHGAILTKHGAVFTFGSGQYGQLGHNSFRHELRPRLVAELWGSKVTKIACGRHHTLVLTDTNKVYSFGCGEQGQLGRKEDGPPSVPLPVQLPQDSSDPKIKNIFAGENCSFVTCSPDEDNSTMDRSVTQHGVDDMVDKWTSDCDLKSWKKIKQEIYNRFSSASCLNKSFLDHRRDKHFQTSPKYSGLNLSCARQAFKKLVNKDNVRAEVEEAVLHFLLFLEKKPVGVEGLRIYLLLNELLYAIQKRTRQQNTKLAEAVAAAVTGLSGESLQVIGDWWSSQSRSTMFRHVKAWKQALLVILSFDPVPRTAGVRNLLRVLQYLYNANSRVAEPQRIPESEFCLLMDAGFLLDDLKLWHARKMCMFLNAEPLILCNFPIVLDLQTKKNVFDMYADYNKCKETQHALLNTLWEWMCFPHPEDAYFLLDVRRSTFLEDTFEQLAAANHRDYKRPLTVYLDENFTIDNVYVKDFFYEVFHKMVSVESGMFMFNDCQTLAWFPSKETTEEDRLKYRLFGVLCGLALYNMSIIHLPFPLVLFKKLLNVEPTLEDMMEFSPSDGQSLQCILDYEDDVIDNLYIDFLVVWDGKEVDLDPENPGKPLTSQNKKEFVDAFINHAFNTSVQRVFQEFQRGFFQVCERDLVLLFRPKELQGLLVGQDFHDWERFKQNTTYEGEYHADHPTIQTFWEVFDELTENRKKALLWFVTGFDRVPILGMDKIKMAVQLKDIRDVSPDKYYPETQTCFSMLMLPLYSTKEIMRAKLTEALSNNKIIFQ